MTWSPRSPGSCESIRYFSPPSWVDDIAWTVLAAGLACALVIGIDIFVRGLGLSLGGSLLPADYLLDLVLAWSIGIIFQYLAIAPMRGASGRKGIWLAIRADTASILAFRVGLFAGMAVYNLGIWSLPLPHASPTYWMMMQLSVILGFFTAMPVNARLIKRGWKEEM